MLLSPRYDKTHCWAWNRVYVKANGRIPCWCDYGEPHTIIHKNLGEHDFMTEVVNCPEMIDMRLATIQRQEHYIKRCKRCCCMLEPKRGRAYRHADHVYPQNISERNRAALKMLQRVYKKRQWEFGSIDKIAEIQLEPSFTCNLRCPGCLHGWHPRPMRAEMKPYTLPMEWFYAMVDSMVGLEVTLQKMSFIGRGEPTLHRQLPEMIAHIREKMPNAVMSMDTNATRPFEEGYLGLDWINCSIDGSNQKSYETYRIGANFDAPMRFLRQAIDSKTATGSKCRVRWKYILFNTTGKIHLLNRAQRIARDLGVDELDFVITAVGGIGGEVKPHQKFRTIQAVKEYLEDNPIFSGATASLS